MTQPQIAADKLGMLQPFAVAFVHNTAFQHLRINQGMHFGHQLYQVEFVLLKHRLTRA